MFAELSMHGPNALQIYRFNLTISLFCLFEYQLHAKYNTFICNVHATITFSNGLL